jgi:hypothetical protein
MSNIHENVLLFSDVRSENNYKTTYKSLKLVINITKNYQYCIQSAISASKMCIHSDNSILAYCNSDAK